VFCFSQHIVPRPANWNSTPYLLTPDPDKASNCFIYFLSIAMDDNRDTMSGSTMGSCSSETAADRVFGIAELAEAILQHLPAKKLFIIQRINHYFQSLIQESIELRKLMFLVPQGPTVKTGLFPYPEDYIFSPWWPHRDFPVSPSPDLVWTPLLTTSNVDKREVLDLPVRQLSGKVALYYYLPFASHYALTWPRSIAHSGSIPHAVRQMLLTQPPVDALRVTASYFKPDMTAFEDPAFLRHKTIREASGITIGLVADTVSSLVAQMISEGAMFDLNFTSSLAVDTSGTAHTRY
jgi:hypothetical protein